MAAAEPPAWAAVGLVGKPGGGGCSGVLIEPDLVLTAGHCVTFTKGADAATRVFRPSTADGAPGVPHQGDFATLHPTWLEQTTLGTDLEAIISRDIALFRLAVPVDPDLARPLPVAGLPDDAATLTLISFRAGRAPLMVRDCPLRDVEDLVFTVDCAVRSGESGAPVAALMPEGPVIVGVVSRRSRAGEVETALGAVLGDNYLLLRETEPPLNAD